MTTVYGFLYVQHDVLWTPMNKYTPSSTSPSPLTVQIHNDQEDIFNKQLKTTTTLHCKADDRSFSTVSFKGTFNHVDNA